MNNFNRIEHIYKLYFLSLLLVKINIKKQANNLKLSLKKSTGHFLLFNYKMGRKGHMRKCFDSFFLNTRNF